VTDSDTHPSMFGRLRKNPHDLATWKSIVSRYGGRIFAWARGRGLGAEDCEDVTQQVLMRLSGLLQTFEYDREKGRFRDYLHRMTRNIAIDLLRKRRRRPMASGSDAIAEVLDSEEARADLSRRLEEEFDLELFELACQRVKKLVSKDTWERFLLNLPQGLGGGGLSPEEAATRIGGRAGLIYQARYKVLPLLQEEVERLGGRNPLV
jgi:RNA polymerase sigma-70 factor (ECF subfamily)